MSSPSTLPPCPHLPSAPASMNASALSAHGADRDGDFYLTALTYAHYLWPLPYAAMAWFLRHAPADVFIGNPRVHFQHLADRMNEPRREQRRWRTWACWQIARVVRPEFPADPRHVVVEPTVEQIAARLDTHGVPGETALWRGVLKNCSGTR
jgi:hypothetical protein